jgi:hypothetical protein
MRKHLIAGTLVAVAVASGGGALAQPAQSCFFVNQWNGWKAPDDHTVYLNVAGGKIYRLDMAGACPELRYPDARLITNDQSGTGTICSALDWDLKVGQGNDIPTPCIVKNMSLLTPEQAAALPKGARP